MSKSLHILEGESLEEFNALRDSLYQQFEPVTDSERSLVDMMVHHQWYMRRAQRMQQTVATLMPDGGEPDPKKMAVMVRYYKTHEKFFSQTKRELDNLRKHQRRMTALTEKRQRQWEQLLKKMPPLTNWVN